MASVFLYETTAPLVPWYERPALEPETVKPEHGVDSAEELGSQDEDGDFLSLDSDGSSLEDLKEAKEEEVEEETAVVVSGAAGGEAATPWSFADGQAPDLRSPLLQLHEEVVCFAAVVSPTPAEQQERKEALERVEEVVHYIWPQASVKVFGSYATGLYLPTSDCDVVVMGSGAPSPVDALRALGRALVQRKVASKLQVVAKARIPIAKFLETRSGISFDISFEQASGPEAVGYVQEALAAAPALRPLCLVLKTFLQQRDLNEVYRGGLGSYALLVMLMAHQRLFQRAVRARRDRDRERERERRRERHAAMNLGALLLDFLDLYGRRLNVRDVGVAAHDGGRFFSKEEEGMEQPDRPWNLCVLDPQAPENDIARGSFNFASVRRAFVHAHGQLAAGLREGGGALQRMIRDAPHLSTRACVLPAWSAPETPPAEAAAVSEGKRSKKRKAERRARAEAEAKAEAEAEAAAVEAREAGPSGAHGSEGQAAEGSRRRHRHKRSHAAVEEEEPPRGSEAAEELEEGEHVHAAEASGAEQPGLSRRQRERLRRREADEEQQFEIAYEERRRASQKEQKVVNGRIDVTQLRMLEQGRLHQSGRGSQYVEPQDARGFVRDYGGGSAWQGRPQQQYGHHSWDQRRRQWHGR